MKYQGLEAKVWGVGIGEEGCGQRAWKSDDREVGGREGGVQELLSRPPTPLLTDRGQFVSERSLHTVIYIQINTYTYSYLYTVIDKRYIHI